MTHGKNGEIVSPSLTSIVAPMAGKTAVQLSRAGFNMAKSTKDYTMAAVDMGSVLASRFVMFPIEHVMRDRNN